MAFDPLPDDELDRLVEKAVLASASSLPVPKLSKALPAGLRPSKPALEASLRRLGQAGRLHRWPLGKAGAWAGRAFEDEIRDRLSSVLEDQPRPFGKLKQAVCAAGDLKGLKPEALARALAALEQSGRAHRWPGGKAGAWATRSFEQALEERIADALASGSSTEVDLQKAIGKTVKPVLRRALDALLASGRIHRHPPAGKLPRYGARPPSAADYAGPALERLIADLRKLGFGALEVRAALVAELGLSPHATTRDGAAPERILEAMAELNPKVHEGDVVYIPHLRIALQGDIPEKLEFDRLMLGLLARDRVTLHPHPAPTQLSEAEREAMLPDGRGSYYMVVGLRR